MSRYVSYCMQVNRGGLFQEALVVFHRMWVAEFVVAVSDVKLSVLAFPLHKESRLQRDAAALCF